MSPYELTDFDVAARFGAKLSGVDFIKLICQVDFPIRFDRWIDSRTQASPDSRNLSADLIGSFHDDSQGGVPWCFILEFKSRPDPNSADQLRGYQSEVKHERPDPEPRSVYRFALGVINLTGEQTFPAPVRFGVSSIESMSPPFVVNLATFDAETVLERIDRGELGYTVLPFLVLMKNADCPEFVTRWLEYLSKETNPRYRREYRVMALIFAQCCGRLDLWTPHLKENEMVLSELTKRVMNNVREEGVKEGHKEGLKEGHKEGLKDGEAIGTLKGQIRLLERFLSLSTTSEETLQLMSLDELQNRVASLEAQWEASRGNGS
jgi:hypothetical protein